MMKKLTYDEFKSRLVEMNNARRIFNNLTDNNISRSWEAYQDLLAEEQSDLFVAASMYPENYDNALGNYKRPVCPDCENKLILKVNQRDQDGEMWPTAWVCNKCDNIFYSTKNPHDWEKELRNEP